MDLLQILLRQDDSHNDDPGDHDTGDPDSHAEDTNTEPEDDTHDTPGTHENGGHTTHSSSVCPLSKSSCLLQPPPNCDVEDGEPCTSKFTFIIFPLIALFIGALGTPLSRKLNISYTLVLLLVGIVLGAVGCGVDLGLLSTSLRQWVHLNPPTAFFYIFLAPLIFEASFNTRWHVFKRLLIPILTAAFIIVSIQVGLIAAFQKLVIRTPKWSWYSALMFGSMLSATDPISVTATLKSLGASELLNTLIEGESLLNDGSAFVLWEAFFENAQEGAQHEKLSNGEIAASIFRLSIGGAAMGVGFGILALIVLGLVYDEFEVETSITVIVAFLGFWTAQAPSKLSGVIANVGSGLIISAFGRHLITRAVREPLAEFWELLGWIANTIVFVHSGVLLTAFTWSCSGEPNEWYDYIYIIVYYLYLSFIRMALILIFSPIMRIRNKWFQWREAVVVGFSGLRGAVSLILALEVAGNSAIPEEVRSRVVLWATGVVALTLLVNGILIKPLISGLKLDKAKKSREDFLHRARALMVQKTLMILDGLCIETNFKSTRWTYVLKSVLPHEWLEETKHAEDYRDFIEQVLDNNRATTHKSLDLVRRDAHERLIHSHLSQRMSTEFGTKSLIASPLMSPRPVVYDYAADIARYSRTPNSAALMSPNRHVNGTPLQNTRSPFLPVASAANVPSRFQEMPDDLVRPVTPSNNMTGQPGTELDSSKVYYNNMPGALAPLSIGSPAPVSVRSSVDGYRTRSIDADVERYGGFKPGIKPTAQGIHEEIADIHRRLATGADDELSEKDREVRRRLLTAILSHVRAIANTSLVEFSVLHNLEEDCQKALDANEEGHHYDLFSFLDHQSKLTRGPVFQFFIKLLEGRTLNGEMATTTAFIVSGIMSEILKEETLHESQIVHWQAEKLYQGSTALLNRLESINSEAFEWVESQFAVYVCQHKQDSVLEDLLESGIVDDQEYHTIHEELIEVRREYAEHRQSLLRRNRKKLPTRPPPRQLLLKHPLFAGLPRDLMQVIDRYGELVHLKGGQALKAERGSLVLVLDGVLRPLSEHVLPENVANQIQKSNAAVDVAAKDRGGATARTPGVNSNVIIPENAWDQQPTSTSNESSTNNGSNENNHVGFTPLGTGAEMYWCFPRHNAFCGSVVTLLSHVDSTGESVYFEKQRAFDTKFGCCEISGHATVFTLPVRHVKQLAKDSQHFRMEITRSLARQIVLESLSDQKPYCLSQFLDTVAGGFDVNTVVGRASRVLERLPYMTVIALHSGESSSVHLQGPGVLLNGTVRVSIVDTSGLVGAINLLHEQLTGPALLPAGGLLIEEIHDPDNPLELKRGMSVKEPAQLESELAQGAAENVENIYDSVENTSGEVPGSPQSKILAHVLIEEIALTDTGVDKTTLLRLQRWTASDDLVNMNGRFGMNRYVTVDALRQVRVQDDADM